MDAFDAYVLRIETEYQHLGHRLGWRFLTSPRRTLSTTTKTLLLSTNPGGNRIPEDHPTASSEAGSAYIVESWNGLPPGQAPLQLQVQQLFEMLDEDLNAALAGYLVPFRSPNFESLPHREESVRFSIDLWTDVFERVDPSLVVTVGKDTFKHMSAAWQEKPRILEEPVGWGSQTALVANYARRVVLALPHLSRFKIFGRPQSQEPIERIIALLRKARPGRG
jgi:hypothetical protein